MRIVQIIDSLQPGGAERMAVNYANALASRIEFSGLVATRHEGGLKSEIFQNVNYQFLHRKGVLDVAALFRLRRYCNRNSVGIVHAHGTSFFIAVLLKLMLPKIKIIWHDHNGDRSNQQIADNRLLFVCSKFFHAVIVVNSALENWARQWLKIEKVINLPNFAANNVSIKKETVLSGKPGGRILLLANLRQPKNHRLAVMAAARLKARYPDCTFHFVGNDFNDAYSDEIKQLIADRNLERTIYIYGLRLDVSNIILQSDIDLLTSDYEGLPVALIEYGMAGKPVVVSAVGELPAIIHHGVNGYIFGAGDLDALCESLSILIENHTMRVRLGDALLTQMNANYSETSVITRYINWLEENGK